MPYKALSLDRLMEELTHLPGIGRKTAQRLAFYILKMDDERVESLVHAIADVKKKIKSCSVCGNITEADPCSICADPSRDHSTICVVEQTSDVFALEKGGEYKGTYHVLNGVLSPLDGIGPDDLNIQSLVKRLNAEEISEIIIATNPNVEGEATASYIYKLLNPFDVKITRIARGLPVGGDLEYVDEVTLMRALEGRQEFK
jgi:recombination protein RecR